MRAEEEQQQQEMVSLYDFQGKRDVERIGDKVYAFAKAQKYKMGRRELGNGLTVMTYPKAALEEYFFLRGSFNKFSKFF